MTPSARRSPRSHGQLIRRRSSGIERAHGRPNPNKPSPIQIAIPTGREPKVKQAPILLGARSRRAGKRRAWNRPLPGLRPRLRHGVLRPDASLAMDQAEARNARPPSPALRPPGRGQEVSQLAAKGLPARSEAFRALAPVVWVVRSRAIKLVDMTAWQNPRKSAATMSWLAVH